MYVTCINKFFFLFQNMYQYSYLFYFFIAIYELKKGGGGYIYEII